MIRRMSEKITDCLLDRNILPQEEKEVYEYGFELLISSLIGFIIVFVSGLIFGLLSESMLFYIIFVSVRPFCGGYHADTHMKCKMTFIVVYALVMLFSQVFANNYRMIYHVLLLAVYWLSIILYAPVEHKNKPLDSEEKARNRKLSIILAAALSAVSAAAAYLAIKYAAVIVLTLFSVSMLMIITKLNKEAE